MVDAIEPVLWTGEAIWGGAYMLVRSIAQIFSNLDVPQTPRIEILPSFPDA